MTWRPVINAAFETSRASRCHSMAAILILTIFPFSFNYFANCIVEYRKPGAGSRWDVVYFSSTANTLRVSLSIVLELYKCLINDVRFFLLQLRKRLRAFTRNNHARTLGRYFVRWQWKMEKIFGEKNKWGYRMMKRGRTHAGFSYADGRAWNVTQTGN